MAHRVVENGRGVDRGTFLVMGGLAKRATQVGIDGLVGSLVMGTGAVMGAVAGAILWLWTFVLVGTAALTLNGRANMNIDLDAITSTWLTWLLIVGALTGALIAVGRTARGSKA